MPTTARSKGSTGVRLLKGGGATDAVHEAQDGGHNGALHIGFNRLGTNVVRTLVSVRHVDVDDGTEIAV